MVEPVRGCMVEQPGSLEPADYSAAVVVGLAMVFLVPFVLAADIAQVAAAVLVLHIEDEGQESKG